MANIKVTNCCPYILLLACGLASCLDNGLVRTPPMGWLSWARFVCEIDCLKYPNDCISEQLYLDMADQLVSGGYKDLGYEYVNIDDCWSEKKRDPQTNQLVADRVRFPRGIKYMADYVHAKGLKLGIYTDIGTETCGGYPGLWIGNGSAADYFLLDAETYSNWTVDSLKVDGCYADTNNMDWLYPRLQQALNLTGREIVYSCSWPAYQVDEAKKPDYELIARTCNLWRNYNDIEDSWQSVTAIIDFYAENQDTFIKFHGPGAWFDPDMVIIGNFGLSLDQSQAQMAIWSVLAAPLLMSNDLRRISNDHKEILQNRHVIGVNQDKLGKMGRRVIKENGLEFWRRPIEPVLRGCYSFAIVYFNRNTLGSTVLVEKTLSQILDGEQLARLYYVYDLFDNNNLIAKLAPEEELVLQVNPSGSVRMVKVVPHDYSNCLA